MSLETTAQEFYIVESPHSSEPQSIVPLEVAPHAASLPESLELREPGEVTILIEDIPGAPPGTKDPEPVLEVSEPEEVKAKDSDENDAKSKDAKWDWGKHGAQGFLHWVKERCDDVPKHSGYDSAGLERAIAYLEKLDAEISRAMRLDLNGDLDANQIEKVRATIDNGIDKLNDRLDKIKSSKKKSKRKKANTDYELVKEGQKITGVQGVVVTVDLLTSRIARVCINGMVSGGHALEDMFNRQVKEYGLNKREQACVAQLLEDMGFALRADRGYPIDEEINTASSDNFDWAANYRG